MKITIISLLLSTSMLQGGGQPINVSIQNPSFEQLPSDRQLAVDPGNPTCGLLAWVSPGWQMSPNTGILQPNTITANACGTSAPPDGSIVAYACCGGTFSQDLGIPPFPNHEGIYLLTFYVANFWYSYQGHYTAKLMSGTTELCSISASRTLGDWTEISLPCPVWVQHPTPTTQVPGDHLIISFSASVADGWKVLVDNVSLHFTPTN